MSRLNFEFHLGGNNFPPFPSWAVCICILFNEKHWHDVNFYLMFHQAYHCCTVSGSTTIKMKIANTYVLNFDNLSWFELRYAFWFLPFGIFMTSHIVLNRTWGMSSIISHLRKYRALSYLDVWFIYEKALNTREGKLYSWQQISGFPKYNKPICIEMSFLNVISSFRTVLWESDVCKKAQSPTSLRPNIFVTKEFMYNR